MCEYLETKWHCLQQEYIWTAGQWCFIELRSAIVAKKISHVHLLHATTTNIPWLIHAGQTFTNGKSNPYQKNKILVSWLIYSFFSFFFRWNKQIFDRSRWAMQKPAATQVILIRHCFLLTLGTTSTNSIVYSNYTKNETSSSTSPQLHQQRLLWKMDRLKKQKLAGSILGSATFSTPVNNVIAQSTHMALYAQQIQQSGSSMSSNTDIVR